MIHLQLGQNAFVGINPDRSIQAYFSTSSHAPVKN